MPGIKTTTLDMGKIGQKFLSATLWEQERKKKAIDEFREEFLRSGKSYWTADNLAKEKYRLIHKK